MVLEKLFNQGRSQTVSRGFARGDQEPHGVEDQGCLGERKHQPAGRIAPSQQGNEHERKIVATGRALVSPEEREERRGQKRIEAHREQMVGRHQSFFPRAMS